MERIGPVSSTRTGRIDRIRPTSDATAKPEPSRALMVIDGRQSESPRSLASLRDGRAEAGFVTQLLAGTDPTLQASRLVRTRQATATYAEMAQRLA